MRYWIGFLRHDQVGVEPCLVVSEVDLLKESPLCAVHLYWLGWELQNRGLAPPLLVAKKHDSAGHYRLRYLGSFYFSFDVADAWERIISRSSA